MQNLINASDPDGDVITKYKVKKLVDNGNPVFYTRNGGPFSSLEFLASDQNYIKIKH